MDERRLRLVAGSFSIPLPMEIMKRHGAKKGDLYEIYAAESGIIILARSGDNDKGAGTTATGAERH